jgi:hypothetical protein
MTTIDGVRMQIRRDAYGNVASMLNDEQPTGALNVSTVDFSTFADSRPAESQR